VLVFQNDGCFNVVKGCGCFIWVVFIILVGLIIIAYFVDDKKDKAKDTKIVNTETFNTETTTKSKADNTTQLDIDALSENEAPEVSEEISFEIYCNEKYDFCISYPTILVPQGEVDDGQIFILEETKLLVCWEFMKNNEGEFIEDVNEAYEKTLSEYEETTQVIYTIQKENFFIISGYDNEKMFYRKTLARRDGVYATGILTYNESNKKYYDDILVEIFNSFEFN
jgi:hypothetical protein